MDDGIIGLFVIIFVAGFALGALAVAVVLGRNTGGSG